MSVPSGPRTRNSEIKPPSGPRTPAPRTFAFKSAAKNWTYVFVKEPIAQQITASGTITRGDQSRVKSPLVRVDPRLRTRAYPQLNATQATRIAISPGVK